MLPTQSLELLGAGPRLRLATDGECNGWEVFRARKGIEASPDSGRGVLGSWDVIIECLDIGGRTDDDSLALFKIC